MASKKDKFKKAASKQLKRATGESGGMEELVRNIEQDRAARADEKAPAESPANEKASAAEKTPADEKAPAPGKAPAAEKEPVTEKAPAGTSESDAYEASLVVEVDSGSHGQEQETPPEEKSAEPVSKVQPVQSAQKANDDPGEGNISLSRTDRSVESGRHGDDPAIRRGAQSIEGDGGTPRRSGSTRRSETIGMAKTRESIYNVSSDIRLEDYTESQSEGGGFGGIAKIAVGLIVLLLLAWGAKSLIGLFFAPEYILAVSAQQITDGNIAQAAQATSIAPGHGGSVFVRFQWNEGELQTDLVRIIAEKRIGGSYREVASKSRTLPETVTYIYFQNSFTPGQYRIQVTSRGGDVLAERELFIR